MLRKLTVVIALLGVVVYAGPQVARRAAKPAARTDYQVVAPSKAKVVPSVPAPKAMKAESVKSNPMSWQEKATILNDLSIKVSAPPANIMNLTVRDHFQTVNGFSAYLYYKTPDYVSADQDTAWFRNSNKTFGPTTWQEPTLIIYFHPRPGKSYLFECPNANKKVTYNVYVHVNSQYAFNQAVTGVSDLLVVFPGTEDASNGYIAIRGYDPTFYAWSFRGCQITEL